MKALLPAVLALTTIVSQGSEPSFALRGPNEIFDGADSSTVIELAAFSDDADPRADWHSPRADEDDQSRQRGFDETLWRLQSGLESLDDRLTVTTENSDWSLRVFGTLSGEMIFAEQRPIIPSGIVFLSPDTGRNTPTVDVHGKSSTLGARVSGPRFGDFDLGGGFLTTFYGENFLSDTTGFLVLAAFGELRNEDWRLSAGQQRDVINPLAPNTLDFARGQGAGNLGFLRGQFRVERHLTLHDDAEMTLLLAVGNPITTAFDGGVRNVVEDNGWPNLDGRIAFGFGPETEFADSNSRIFEFGVGGLIGQLRQVGPMGNVADVWAFGADARLVLTDRAGIQGEFFTGQAIGNYNAAILQIFDPQTERVVRTTGGWGEFYFYWTPCLHSHIGLGIDDPRDETLSAGRPSQNAFRFANLIWDASDNVEVGVEVAHWETDYIPGSLAGRPLGGNEAMIYRTRVRLKF